MFDAWSFFFFLIKKIKPLENIEKYIKQELVKLLLEEITIGNTFSNYILWKFLTYRKINICHISVTYVLFSSEPFESNFSPTSLKTLPLS